MAIAAIAAKVEALSGFVEVQAFPAGVRDQLVRLLPALAAGQWHAPSPTFHPVIVDGEALRIPHRVYYDADRIREVVDRDDIAGCIARCLGTIHHDGFLREACARQLMHDDRPWVVPYIVNLVGEYVLEIIVRIEQALPFVDKLAYGRFVATNPRWFSTIERRVTSYWNAYYRDLYPQCADYSGTRVVARLREFARATELA